MALDEITNLYNSNGWRRHAHDTWEAYVRDNLPIGEQHWPPSVRRVIVQRLLGVTTMTVSEMAVTLGTEPGVIEQDILDLRHG